MKFKNKVLMLAIVFFMVSIGYRMIAVNTDHPFAAIYSAKADVVVSKGSNIKCQTDGIVPNELVTFAEKELSLIPEGFRRAFVEDGWHIYITTENLSEVYFNGEHTEVYGCTFYEKELILMANNKKAIETATVHEFGHWVDHYFGDISRTDEFTIIYEKEHRVFLDYFARNCKMDITEYFAESFYHYVKHPEQLKNVAPATYAVFENLAG